MILNSTVVSYAPTKIFFFLVCVLYRRRAEEYYLAPIFVTDKHHKDRQTDSFRQVLHNMFTKL
jgi:hypothetical protein